MAKPTRRSVMARLMAAAALAGPTAAMSQAAPFGARPRRLEARIVDSVEPQSTDDPGTGPRGPVRIDEFNMVGQYDVDWLIEPPLQRLLDAMAGSPSAFGSVRFFHALDSGTL